MVCVTSTELTDLFDEDERRHILPGRNHKKGATPPATIPFSLLGYLTAIP